MEVGKNSRIRIGTTECWAGLFLKDYTQDDQCTIPGQAAVDLSMGHVLSAVTLQRYLIRLRQEYQRMMMIKPDMSEWYYDKNRSIIKTFSILKEAIAKSNSDSLRLLTFASFFATGNIPIIMIDRTQSFKYASAGNLTDLLPELGYLSLVLRMMICAVFAFELCATR